MRTVLPYIHVLLAGLWIGCILTEALFERAMLAGDRRSHAALAELHVRVDNFVEIPAFLGVLLTGWSLYPSRSIDGPWFHLKIAAGLAAILVNVYCVVLVYQRRAAAQTGDWDRFDWLDHRQHPFGAAVLVFALIAMLIGMALKHLR